MSMSRSRGSWLAPTASPESLAAGSVFEAMLYGWRDQQLARRLNEMTIVARERVVRRLRGPTPGCGPGSGCPGTWSPGSVSCVSTNTGPTRPSAATNSPLVRSATSCATRPMAGRSRARPSSALHRAKSVVRRTWPPTPPSTRVARTAPVLDPGGAPGTVRQPPTTTLGASGEERRWAGRPPSGTPPC
jgi:hypothetical protein